MVLDVWKFLSEFVTVADFLDGLYCCLSSFLFSSFDESCFNELKKSLRLSKFFVCVIQLVCKSNGIERVVVVVIDEDDDVVPFGVFGVLNRRSLRVEGRWDP